MEPDDRHEEKIEVRLGPAPASLKPIFRTLLTQYLAELASIQGQTPPRDERGQVPYRWFEVYWQDFEPERIPFGLWLADDLAGFCLLRDTGDHWQVAEFFVLPAYRRRGIGARAVALLKEFCRRSRKYNILEANTLLANNGALAFWHSQGFVPVSESPERMINVFCLNCGGSQPASARPSRCGPRRLSAAALDQSAEDPA
jgi:predicted acetyltransferase